MCVGIESVCISSRGVFFASLLGLFNGAELEDPTRIFFRCYRPPARAVSQETLEARFLRCGHGCLVHFFDRAELLYASICPHFKLNRSRNAAASAWSCKRTVPFFMR